MHCTCRHATGLRSRTGRVHHHVHPPRSHVTMRRRGWAHVTSHSVRGCWHVHHSLTGCCAGTNGGLVVHAPSSWTSHYGMHSRVVPGTNMVMWVVHVLVTSSHRAHLTHAAMGVVDTYHPRVHAHVVPSSHYPAHLHLVGTHHHAMRRLSRHVHDPHGSRYAVVLRVQVGRHARAAAGHDVRRSAHGTHASHV